MNGREEAIAKMSGSIKRINDISYTLNSRSGNGSSYDINATEIGWVCSCPDHKFRGVKCKHIYAVEISFALRKEVEVRRIEPVNIQGCIFCKSFKIVKDGIRHNKHGDIQKFNCRDCRHYFTVNVGFEKMKHNPQGITTAMQLYYSGESLKEYLLNLFRLIGMEVTHQTVYNWIQKYTGLMVKYLEQITPNVSDAWRTTTISKVKGNMKYLYALMDDETSYG